MHFSKIAVNRFVSAFSLLCLVLIAAPSMAQVAPPTLGQETKGEPAVDETAPLESSTAIEKEEVVEATETGSQSGIDSLLGEASIRESKRENGQVFLIELEHSSGAKQYIEETDSDGKIESTSNDIEETPNLPKWKLGSW